MELTMDNQENFLKPLLDMMNQRMDGLSAQMTDSAKKIDTNTALTNKVLAQANKTNGRVNGLEQREADAKNVKAAHKYNLSPNVIYLIAVAGVIIVIVVASLLGFGGVVQKLGL
jgi:hypothetical protein